MQLDDDAITKLHEIRRRIKTDCDRSRPVPTMVPTEDEMQRVRTSILELTDVLLRGASPDYMPPFS